MEQFALVLASAYNNNKSFNTQAVLKQELPRYQVEQNHMYQIDSPKKGSNKKLFAKADSLVDENLSGPPIKLANYQALRLDCSEFWVQLSYFAQQFCHKNADVPDIYFTLPDAAGRSPTLVLNQNAKAKERGSWVFPKNERQELPRLYTQGSAAYVSVRNLKKASNLPVSKLRQFIHFKLVYPKFTLATRKFKRMKAFARLKNEICCMDLAYVDKVL